MFYILAAGLFLATVLPLLRSSAWWIRGLDFPRAQIAVAGAVVLAVWAYAQAPKSFPELLLFGCLALSVLYQTARMLPYTPVFPREVRKARASSPETTLAVVVANVLMDNRNSDRLLELIAETDPDLVLAVEPDAWWAERLEALSATHPHVVSKPLDNTYGMVLYSRLELADAEIKFLVEEDVPSIHARVILRSGAPVRLHCLHPKPPYPAEAEQTVERDGELLLVGRELGRVDVPAVLIGDLNDVAWSSTTRLLRKVSGLLDPRIGRGLFSTFHARIPFLRWPLDHVFHSHHFQLARLERLPAFGSDHFPIYARLVLTPWAPKIQGPPEADPEDKARARGMIREADPADTAILGVKPGALEP